MNPDKSDTFYMTQEQQQKAKQAAKDNGFGKDILKFVLCTVLTLLSFPAGAFTAIHLGGLFPRPILILLIFLIIGTPAILGLRFFFRSWLSGGKISAEMDGVNNVNKQNKTVFPQEAQPISRKNRKQLSRKARIIYRILFWVSFIAEMTAIALIAVTVITDSALPIAFWIIVILIAAAVNAFAFLNC